MATAPDWTPEEDAWLIECYATHSNRELEQFKALDGWPRSVASIMGHAKKLGLRKDRSKGYRKSMPTKVWTPEVIAWFREYAPDHLWDEVSAEAKCLFGITLTRSAVQNARRKFDAHCNIHDAGRFKPGQEPPNKGRSWSEWMPEESAARSAATWFAKGEVHGAAAERLRDLLDVRESKGGYLEIKVSPRNERHAMDRWIPLGCFEWMRANGRDWPDGCRCCHVDGDPANNDPDNIVPVPADLWPLVMGANPSSLPYHDRETLEVAITSARITRRRAELARQRRIAEGRPWAQDMRQKPSK